MYGRTSPLTNLLYSGVVENANYFGEPFEDVGDWGKFMLDKITPIAVQGVIEDPQAETAVAEFGGLRAFPKSPWELLDEQRDKQSVNQFNVPYDSLNDLQKMQVNKSGEVKELQKTVDEMTVTRGDATSVAFLNRQREQEAARKVYEETLWGYQRAYEAGQIDGPTFREKMSEAGYGLGVTYNHINSQYPEVMAIFDEPRNLKDKTIGDIAYAEYMDKLYGENGFEDANGIFDYEAYNEYKKYIQKKYGAEVWEYIQELKRERNETLPPLAQEYNEAKEIMQPYWDIQGQVEARFGRKLDSMPLPLQRKAQTLITKTRQLLRLRNPQIAYYWEKFFKQT